MSVDLVIVGAGAAGLMAAIAAGEAGVERSVVLERSRDGGRKILISGGGRCNVLPSALDPAQYHTRSSPHSLRKMLMSWPLAEQRAWFEGSLGIPLQLEAETGKLFPASNRARGVRDALVTRARSVGAEIRFEHSLEGLRADGDGWLLSVVPGGSIRTRAVILATGGLSVPATGSDGTGIRILEGLGHRLRELHPALTPLLAPDGRHADLAGVSLDVTIEVENRRGRPAARGGFLFTHRGYSGPAVLDVSHHTIVASGANEPARLVVRWSHEGAERWDARLRDAGQEEGASVPAASMVRRALPDRLVARLFAEAGVAPETPLSRLGRTDRQALARALGAWTIPWSGNEGYRKAEVTGGGIALDEVDPRTLESRRSEGLFLSGELLDTFGPIGGYNFAWAWATGRLAGRGAAARLAGRG